MDMTNTSTSATTHCNIWMHEVITTAGVGVEDMERFCGRERVMRWFKAGEPVWMAADSLRHMVVTGKRYERADREVNYLNGKMKVK